MREERNGALRIFQALSGVDEELLAHSDGEKKVIPFGRYAKVMAACLCFVVLGIVAVRGARLATENSTSSDCAAPMELMQQADTGTAEEYKEEAAVEDAVMEDAAEEGEAEAIMPEAEYDTDGLQENQISGSTISDALTDDASCIVESVPEEAVAEDMKNAGMLSAYIPAELPEGFSFEGGHKKSPSDGPESISLTWTKGMDYISITVVEYLSEEELGKRLADVSKPETYDVHLYEIPYADTVPDEVSDIFHNPIFRVEDLDLAVVEARMKQIGEEGDTDTPRGNLAILYETGVVAEIRGCGNAEAIWKMIQSMHTE